MSFLKPDVPQIPLPKTPEPTPPVLAPQGTKPGTKNKQVSFLGAGAVPDQTSGGAMGKTLLGQ